MRFSFSNIVQSISIVLLLCVFSACNSINTSKLQNNEITPSEQTYKPWAYWWWMGNSVSKDGISKNLKAYKEAGFGGLHIIPIYGEKGDEDNFIQYLSPLWMEMLVHTVNEAKNLGMGIDMTTGTGWPFGGPNMSFTNSAKTIVIKEIDLSTVKDIRDITKEIKGGELIALSAQKNNTPYENIIEIVQNDGSIPNASSYNKVFALIMRPTRQKVKRAAPGGEGLVIDYFNKNSINHYLTRFQAAFDSTQFTSGKVRSFYNDSYEVYGANFTTNFLEKFNDLRGYDLTNYINVLADTNFTPSKERIITDYCETISDLLYTEFSLPWVKKSNEMGLLTRNQAHGSPGNILDLYGAADIPETESFGVSNIPIPGLRQDPDFEEDRFGRPNPLTMKFASSAANIKNKNLVSSETATWLGDHFKVALSQIKPQIDELFTSGINHVFFHGITYNPPEKPFPGRLFYASTNFGTKSHFWNELPALNKYIERCQKVLQNTKADNDILVYFPIHDIWAKKSADEIIVRLDVHHSSKWLEESNFGSLISTLWQDGFTFDYVSDLMLNDASVKDGKIRFDGGSYKTIIIPQCVYMPEQTLENLRSLAKSGAHIIFQENLPETVPGFYDVKKREKKFTTLKTAIEPVVSITNNIPSELLKSGVKNEALAKLGLSFIRKKGDDEVVYFIANLGDKFSQGLVNLTKEFKQVEYFNPLTGEKGILNSEINNGETEINLQLEPGKSCILTCSNRQTSEKKWSNYITNGNAIVLNSEWTITPINESNNLPKSVKTKTFKSWPLYGNNWAVYSGKAVYASQFEIDEKYIGKEMLIDLGDVRETAKIKINDSIVDLLWCIPYKTIIQKDILKKKNTIEIEVTNLSFNKVIELDREGVEWKNFNEINFVNIKYEPYDASDKEPVESGLLDDIKLFPIVIN